MATSLAAQLEHISEGERRVPYNGKASFLYDAQQAADVDLLTIYTAALAGALPWLACRSAPALHLAVAGCVCWTRSPNRWRPAGFEELRRLDGRFETYNKALFSKPASELSRELQVWARCVPPRIAIL